MHTFTVTQKPLLANYIRNNYFNFGVFAAHRVQEIRNNNETKQWYYVPSKLNIADDATRCVPSKMSIIYKTIV